MPLINRSKGPGLRLFPSPSALNLSSHRSYHIQLSPLIPREQRNQISWYQTDNSV